MHTVRYQFVRGKGFTSRAIGYFGGDYYSHVDIILPNGRLFGARSDRVGGRPPGVWDRPPNYEQWAARCIIQLGCTTDQYSKFYATAVAQTGKPYDHLAIVAFALNRNWRESDSWICSELGAYCLEQAGICHKLVLPANKVTPGALALVCSALSAEVYPYNPA